MSPSISYSGRRTSRESATSSSRGSQPQRRWIAVLTAPQTFCALGSAGDAWGFRPWSRSYEVVVGGRVKFRVGRIVYLSFSRDHAVMGFAFPKEEREWLIGGSPGKFMYPGASDMRYHWVQALLSALEPDEMRELVVDAWRMVVPRSVAAAHLGD